MSGLVLRVLSRSVISTACAWWAIMPCMKATSAAVNRVGAGCRPCLARGPVLGSPGAPGCTTGGVSPGRAAAGASDGERERRRQGVSNGDQPVQNTPVGAGADHASGASRRSAQRSRRDEWTACLPGNGANSRTTAARLAAAFSSLKSTARGKGVRLENRLEDRGARPSRHVEVDRLVAVARHQRRAAESGCCGPAAACPAPLRIVREAPPSGRALDIGQDPRQHLGQRRGLRRRVRAASAV